MYALYFVAKNNLKKKKGEAAVLILLTALSAMLCYSSISVIVGITNVMDTAYENAHTADVLYTFDQGYEEKLSALFDSDGRVTEFEKNEMLSVLAEYRSSLSEEKSEYMFWIERIEDERNISTLYGANAENPAQDAVLLPYYLKTAYSEGDAFYLTLGEKEHCFTVAGFVEDPMLGTPLNVTVYHIYISKAYFSKLMEEPAISSQKAVLYKLRLKEGINTVEYEEEMTDVIAKQIPETAEGANRVSINWMGMRGAGCTMSYIGMGLALVFSVLLICVTLIIVRFGIRNFIERNLKNIGILQAGGYTARQLRLGTVLEMGIISASGAAAGVLLGIAGSGVTGSLQAMLSGLEWKEKINGGIVFLVFAITVLIVCGAAFLTGKTYRKITVLDALRGGIHTHNFKRCVLPLERSRLPLPLLLALKGTLGEKKNSISVFCIAAILSVTACVSFSLFEHFVFDSDTLLDFAGIDNGDVALYGSDLEDIKEELEEWEEVTDVLTYQVTSAKLIHGEKERIISCDIWNDFELLRHDMLLEGRFPRYENEIVLSTNIAKELGVSTGDIIYVEGRDGKQDYMVTGIDQKINHMGLKAMLTVEGLKRSGVASYPPAIFLYLKEDISFEEIREKLEQNFSGIEISDSRRVIEETTSSISYTIGMICTIFLLVTSLIIMFVEILLIHAKVIRERKNYGIHKALGYTTLQLMIQTMMSNIPVVFLGAVFGVAISEELGNRLAMACFSFFGLKKVSLPVRPVWMLASVIAITAIALAASFFTAVKIRKIEPVDLIKEE